MLDSNHQGLEVHDLIGSDTSELLKSFVHEVALRRCYVIEHETVFERSIEFNEGKTPELRFRSFEVVAMLYIVELFLRKPTEVLKVN